MAASFYLGNCGCTCTKVVPPTPKDPTLLVEAWSIWKTYPGGQERTNLNPVRLLVTIDKPDLLAQQNGQARFFRTYAPGTVITLSMIPPCNATSFRGWATLVWTQNGLNTSIITPSRTVTVTIPATGILFIGPVFSQEIGENGIAYWNTEQTAIEDRRINQPDFATRCVGEGVAPANISCSAISQALANYPAGLMAAQRARDNAVCQTVYGFLPFLVEPHKFITSGYWDETLHGWVGTNGETTAEFPRFSYFLNKDFAVVEGLRIPTYFRVHYTGNGSATPQASPNFYTPVRLFHHETLSSQEMRAIYPVTYNPDGEYAAGSIVIRRNAGGDILGYYVARKAIFPGESILDTTKWRPWTFRQEFQALSSDIFTTRYSTLTVTSRWDFSSCGVSASKLPQPVTGEAISTRGFTSSGATSGDWSDFPEISCPLLAPTSMAGYFIYPDYPSVSLGGFNFEIIPHFTEFTISETGLFYRFLIECKEANVFKGYAEVTQTVTLEGEVGLAA